MSQLEDMLSAFLPEVYEAMERLGIPPEPIDFEIVPADAIYELASYGLPGHYTHWTYGRDYWRMKQQFESGAGRLYEMITESDPPVAYLLESNTLSAQKLVIAHCLGHADMFRHHARSLGGRFANSVPAASERLAQYRTVYGDQAVDLVLDRALAIQDQVADESRTSTRNADEQHDPYDDLWPRARHSSSPQRTTPWTVPTADVLGFIAQHSPALEDWERDVCEVVRAEGLYYQPKRAIKMLHEGWATFCHHTLLQALPLSAGEHMECARIHAQVAWPNPVTINPYWFGWRLIQSLVDEWGLLGARQIIMQETDASVVRSYLTADRVRELELYRYAWKPGYVTDSRGGGRAVWGAEAQADDARVVRDYLANALSDRPPEVIVQSVDSGNRLILAHSYEGLPLDGQWAQMTIESIHQLWGNAVVLHDGEALYISRGQDNPSV